MRHGRCPVWFTPYTTWTHSCPPWSPVSHRVLNVVASSNFYKRLHAGQLVGQASALRATHGPNTIVVEHHGSPHTHSRFPHRQPDLHPSSAELGLSSLTAIGSWLLGWPIYTYPWIEAPVSHGFQTFSFLMPLRSSSPSSSWCSESIIPTNIVL